MLKLVLVLAVGAACHAFYLQEPSIMKRPFVQNPSRQYPDENSPLANFGAATQWTPLRHASIQFSTKSHISKDAKVTIALAKLREDSQLPTSPLSTLTSRASISSVSSMSSSRSSMTLSRTPFKLNNYEYTGVIVSNLPLESDTEYTIRFTVPMIVDPGSYALVYGTSGYSFRIINVRIAEPEPYEELDFRYLSRVQYMHAGEICNFCHTNRKIEKKCRNHFEGYYPVSLDQVCMISYYEKRVLLNAFRIGGLQELDMLENIKNSLSPKRSERSPWLQQDIYQLYNKELGRQQKKLEIQSHKQVLVAMDWLYDMYNSKPITSTAMMLTPVYIDEEDTERYTEQKMNNDGVTDAPPVMHPMGYPVETGTTAAQRLMAADRKRSPVPTSYADDSEYRNNYCGFFTGFPCGRTKSYTKFE